MITDPIGLTLVTLEQNPLQDMILAPFTKFENGKRILYKPVDNAIDLYMAVSIGAAKEISSIKPVIYRFNGNMQMDNPYSLMIRTHWRSLEYDHEEPRPRSSFDPLARFDKW